MAGTCSNLLKIRASDESILEKVDSYLQEHDNMSEYFQQLESEDIPQACVERIDQQEEKIKPAFHWWVGISRPPINEVSYRCIDIMVDDSLVKDREMSWETIKYPSLASIYRLSELFEGVVFDLDFENFEDSIKGRVAFKEGRVKVYR